MRFADVAALGYLPGMAQGGNGIDIGAVYQLLTQVAQTVQSHTEEFGRIHSRLDGVDRRLDGVDRRLDGVDRRLNELGRSVEDLRSAVTEYHATVVGHGILYSELEQRVRRIERHLKLEPTGK